MRELTQVNQTQSKELKRLQKELSDLIGQLNTQKRDYEDKLGQFEKLSQYNDEQQSMHWDVKIETLQGEIRKAENARREIQFKIDNFYRSVTVKLDVLSNPYQHMAPQTQEYFQTKRQQLNE